MLNFAQISQAVGETWWLKGFENGGSLPSSILKNEWTIKLMSPVCISMPNFVEIKDTAESWLFNGFKMAAINHFQFLWSIELITNITLTQHKMGHCEDALHDQSVGW